MDKGKPLTGQKVFIFMASAFGVIIAVNLTLAYQAVSTFPGLEVKNSYIASQGFDADRQAQLALGWDVSAHVEDRVLRLRIDRDSTPVIPKITSATLGRATTVTEDQHPIFTHDGTSFVAPVDLATGNWNLRLVAEAANGTMFKQRIIVRVVK